MNIKSAVFQDKCYCNAYLEVTSQTSNTNIQHDKQLHTHVQVCISKKKWDMRSKYKQSLGLLKVFRKTAQNLDHTLVKRTPHTVLFVAGLVQEVQDCLLQAVLRK